MKIWTLNKENRSAGLGTTIEAIWVSKPLVDEVTKITQDPQMSIAILRGSGVTRGSDFYWLKEETNGEENQ